LRNRVIIFLLIALRVNVNAQNLNLSFKQYTVNDGLASNEVYQVFKDKKGLVWFATDGGISKFDGKKFKNFNRNNGLKENTIFGFYEDFEGKIWYRGINGLIGYIQHDSIFNLAISDILKKKLKNGWVHTMCITSDRTLHLGFYYNVFSFASVKYPYINKLENLKNLDYSDSSSFFINRIDTLNFISSIVSKNTFTKVKTYSDNILFTGYASFYEDYKFKRTKPIALSNISNSSTFIFKNINGEAFFIFKNIFIKDFSGKNTFRKDLSSIIISMDEFNDKQYILSTQSNGALLYNSKTNTLNSIGGVISDVISSTCKSNENGLFYSTTNHGVFHTKDIRVQVFNNTNIVDFKSIGDRFLMLLDNGDIKLYSRLDFKLLDYLKYNNKIVNPSAGMRNIHFISDSVFISGNSLVRLKSNKLVLIKLLNRERLKFDKHQCLKAKPALVTSNLIMIDTLDFKLYEGLLNYPRLKSIFYLNADTTLYYYNGGAGIFGTDYNFNLDKQIKTVSGYSIFQIFSTPSKFVVVTNNIGILIYDRKFKLIRHIQSDKLLNKIRRANFDGKSLLINTNRGVLVFRDVLNSDAFYLFNSKSGLLNDETNAAALINDTLYVSTLEGLNYFNIDSVLNNQPKVPLYFDNLVIDNQVKYFSNDTLIQLELPHKSRSVRLNLLFPNFKNADGRRYYYKLSKSDTSYIETAEDYILLDRLRSGTYEIEVFAKTAENILSKNRIHASITIQKAFWETWWFYALIYLVLACLSYLGIRFWLNRRALREKEKANLLVQIVELQSQALSLQMNPHFIFNAINSIQNFILKANQEQAYNYLTKFSKLIRKVLEVSRKEVTTLAEELQIVEWNCELEALRFGDEFSFEMIISERAKTAETLLPSLTLQPYIENAIWHGLAKIKGEKQLKITVLDNLDQIIVNIEDNGIGINESVRSKEQVDTESFKKESLAMQIIRQRIINFNIKYNINVQIDVIDKSDLNSKDNGTLVRITLPSKVKK
jgi:hypothetical protein